MFRTAQRFLKVPFYSKRMQFMQQNIALQARIPFQLPRMMFSKNNNNNNDDNKNDDDIPDQKIIDSNENPINDGVTTQSSSGQQAFDSIQQRFEQDDLLLLQQADALEESFTTTSFKRDTKVRKHVQSAEKFKNSDGSYTLPLIPIIEHPIVTSFPIQMALTKDLYYKFLANNFTHVVATVMANQDLILENIDPKIPSLQSASYGRAMNWPRLPKVNTLQDIFDIGTFCDFSLTKNPHDNTSPPYYATLHPSSRAKILELLQPTKSAQKITKQMKQVEIAQEKIQQQRKGEVKDEKKEETRPRKRHWKKEYPINLPIVRVMKIAENLELMQKDLTMEQQVNFQFLRSFYERILAVIRDHFTLMMLRTMEKKFNFLKVYQFLDYLLIFLASPTTPGFERLGHKRLSNKKAQKIFQETDLFFKMKFLNDGLSELYSRMMVWLNLENHVISNQEYRVNQQKQAEIYEILKQKFTGESDDRKVQAKKFRKNLEGKKVPKHIQKIIDQEIQRFLSMDKNMSQSQVTKTYLEILTSLPFGVTTQENFEIKKAKEILDQGHYGMDDVKERILQFIAVAKLKGTVHGKILCFVGPPGVGKTSIGESIAKAINRKFARIAVGGDQDTNVLKGFRKTYIGSEPGKIIKALRNCEAENPVIMIDEIDKLGMRSMQGDPSSVLLEILDPQQNHSFTDNYLDTAVDLSKVLFLCTANMLDTIPGPLLDRMDVINVSGYTHDEKTHILERYLKPKAIEKSGLNKVQNEIKFDVTKDAVFKLIQDYCREPGVRSLQRYINRIMEKIALKVVNKISTEDEIKEKKSEEENQKDAEQKVASQDQVKQQKATDQQSDGKVDEAIEAKQQQKEIQSILVSKDNLDQYIGNPKFSSKRIYQKTPIGVVIGLAYNQYGGSILYIQSSQSSGFHKKPQQKADKVGSLKLTGRLGQVMSESSSLAYSFAKRFIASTQPQNEQARSFLEKADIHLHFPEGAVPKDGPSAGISITSSLISLALNKPIKQGIGMTGQITLNGKVLPIGGVKQKTMAAIRQGIFTLIFPKQNEKDVNKLPDFIKKDIKIHYVVEYKDVFDILFNYENDDE